MYNVELQHSKKKYHAIERIRLLLDRGSFHETGAQVWNYMHDEGKGTAVPYDGVITGYGTVHGQPVYVFSQDFTVKAGTIGRRHGEQIARNIERAVQDRCPIIGIYDSGGARIEESINALAGCAEMLHWNTLASGSVPQIAVVLGPCAGAASYSPALSDFVFMVDPISNMYITGPDVVRSVSGSVLTHSELGGAKVHSERSGVAHFCYRNEKQCFSAVRSLLSYLPSSCDEAPKRMDAPREAQVFAEALIPEEPQKVYDVRKVLEAVLDEESFLEVSSSFAHSMVVGLGRLNGRTVGIIANQTLHNCGAIDCDASDKAARMVRFCDAFRIPLLTFVDTPGYMPGADQEHNGILRHGAKLLYAYSEASVPKLTVVLRKAYGGAYIAMCSKHLGADRVYALPTAQIAVMGAEGAVSIVHKKKLASLPEEEKQAYFDEQVALYQKNFMNANTALHEGFADELLAPQALRSRLADDLRILEHKRPLMHIGKRHGNIPL